MYKAVGAYTSRHVKFGRFELWIRVTRLLHMGPFTVLPKDWFSFTVKEDIELYIRLESYIVKVACQFELSILANSIHLPVVLEAPSNVPHLRTEYTCQRHKSQFVRAYSWMAYSIAL